MPITTLFLLIALEQHPTMPAGMTHSQHLAQLERERETRTRGAAAMGFDQDATTHHFVLRPDGGAIEVATNVASDAINREAIRTHLKEIARNFARGIFDKPFATHAEMPPGVAQLQRLTNVVLYRYEETDRGGRVLITTTNREALSAIHEFLRYQITEHRTGDPTSIKG
jgi:hypothetical protein